MRPQVPIAKLVRPRLHNALKRERLFKKLDQRATLPIIWVSGPPGCGKTTLVASYIEARKAKAYWYQVDEGDLDSATLFAYLNELARGPSRLHRKPLPILTPQYLPDIPQFTRRFFREFYARLSAGSVIVLDNCHEAASENFHRILRAACTEIQNGITLIALSRSTRPRELARFAALGELGEIGWTELRLARDETRTIAKMLGIQSLQSDEAL